MNYLPLIGRIFYALIFITSGFGHIANSGQMSQYAASMGVPMPTVAVIVTGIMILLGGLSIALGYKPKIGAILLVVFLVPTTFIMHAFWKIDDPMQSQIQMAMFMKNISMLGAVLVFYYFGTGPMSLEKQQS